jgi:hypothetical protein
MALSIDALMVTIILIRQIVKTAGSGVIHHIASIKLLDTTLKMIFKHLSLKLSSHTRVLKTVRSGPNPDGPRSRTVHGLVQNGLNSKKPNSSHRWPPGAGPPRDGPRSGPVRIFFYINWKK